MRSYCFNDGKIVLLDKVLPVCKKGGVIFKPLVMGICRSDIKLLHRSKKENISVIPGHEAIGIIYESRSPLLKKNELVALSPLIACGHCISCQHGQSIYCSSRNLIGFTRDGSFTDYMVFEEADLKADILHHISGVDEDAAIFAEPLGTCLEGIKRLQLGNQKRSVCIIGGGTMGRLAAIALTSLNVCNECVMIESHMGRSKNNRGLNSQIFLGTAEQVKDKTNNKKYDIVWVATSSKKAQKDAFKYVRPGGRVLFFAGIGKNDKMQISHHQIHYQGVSITGTHGVSAEMFTRSLQLLKNKTVNCSQLITKSFGFDNISRAFYQAQKKKHFKIILRKG